MRIIKHHSHLFSSAGQDCDPEVCETVAAALPSPQPLLRAAVGETDKGEEQLTPEQNAVVLTRSRKT